MNGKRSWVLIGMATVVMTATAACSGGTPAATPSPSRSATGTDMPGAATGPASAAPVAGPYAPAIDPAKFGTTVDNPFFPLRTGMRWEYRAHTPDGVETTVVTVTSESRTIQGVGCVEVRDTVRLNDALIEDTLDWYAQDRTGTVWYFGEDTKEYDKGKVTSTEGSWIAGERGAQPGILMPARPQPSDRYRQEYYRGHAEDQAEVLSLTEQARVPAGSYEQVVMTKETTPLEPAVLEHKYYARGIGMVLTVDLNAAGARDELIRFTSAR